MVPDLEHGDGPAVVRAAEVVNARAVAAAESPAPRAFSSTPRLLASLTSSFIATMKRSADASVETDAMLGTVMVTGVRQKGAAQKSDIKVGDVILEVRHDVEVIKNGIELARDEFGRYVLNSTNFASVLCG